MPVHVELHAVDFAQQVIKTSMSALSILSISSATGHRR
jgi:hypothetical protein